MSARTKKLGSESNSDLDSSDESDAKLTEEDVNEIIMYYEESEFEEVAKKVNTFSAKILGMTVINLVSSEDDMFYALSNAIFEVENVDNQIKNSIANFYICQLAGEHLEPAQSRLLADHVSSVITMMPIKFILKTLDDMKIAIHSGSIGFDGCIIDFLPSLIESVCNNRQIPVGSELKSSADVISYFIEDLTSPEHEWSTESIAPTLKNINRCRLNDDILLKLVERVIYTIKELRIYELQPVVLELIKFKRKPIRHIIVRNIVSLFNKEILSPETELGVIAIIDVFIKQIEVEAEFGKIILALFTKYQENVYFNCFAMFPFGLLLSLSNLGRYKEATQKLLKSILKRHKNQLRLQHRSRWLASALNNKEDVQNLIINFAKVNKSYTSAVVSILFSILDGANQADFHNFAAKMLQDLSRHEDDNIKQTVVAEILLRFSYSHHPMLEKIIFSSLVLRRDIELESDWIDKSSFQLETLHLLQTSMISPILTCLLHASVDRNTIIKFIRKSANAANTANRILAAKGYMILLEQTKIESGFEQSQAKDRNVHFSHTGEEVALCEEFLDGMLRSLGQQLEVKDEIYISSYDVVRFNPGISPSLCDIFLERLNLHVEKKGPCPFKTQGLVVDGKLMENIPLLLALVYNLSERIRDNDVGNETFCQKVEKIQYKVEDILITCVRSDFKVRQLCDDITSILHLVTAINILEVSIEFQFRRSKRTNFPDGSVEFMEKLIILYDELTNFFESKCGRMYAKVKVPKEEIPHIKNGSFSLLSLSKMTAVFTNKHRSGNAEKYAKNSKLLKMYFSKLSHKLKEIVKPGYCTDFIATDYEKIGKLVTDIGSSTLMHISQNRMHKGSKINSNIYSQHLDIFCQCLTIVQMHYGSMVENFATVCWGKCTENTLNVPENADSLEYLNYYFRRSLRDILIAEQDTPMRSKADLNHMLAILDLLNQAGNQSDVDIMKFIKCISENGFVEDPKSAAAVLKQLIDQANFHTDDCLPVIIDIAADLHFNFENISNEDIHEPGDVGEIKSGTNYRILKETHTKNESKNKEVLFVISSEMEKVAEETELTIKKFQHALQFERYFRDDATNPVIQNLDVEKKKLNKIIIQRLFAWSLVIEQLIQSRLPTAQCTKHVIDRSIEFLKALKNYIKLFDAKGEIPPTVTIKGIERKIPNIGRLLNVFIDYLDNMPDELEPPKKKRKGVKGNSDSAKCDKSVNTKLPTKVRQKLFLKNRRLPELLLAYAELLNEITRFANDFNRPELGKKFDMIVQRDIDFSVN